MTMFDPRRAQRAQLLAGVMSPFRSPVDTQAALLGAQGDPGQGQPQLGGMEAGGGMAAALGGGDDDEGPSAWLKSGAGAAGGGGDDSGAPDLSGGTGDLSGWHGNFMEMIKKQMAAGDDEPLTAEDKGLALAKAGFGMAASGAHTFGQALGQGAMYGLEGLEKLKAQRAQQRLRRDALMQQVGLHEEDLAGRRDIANQASIDRNAGIAQREADSLRDNNRQIQHDKDMALLGQGNLDLRRDLADQKQAGTDAATPPKKDPGQTSDQYFSALQSWDPGFAAQAQAIANYQQPLTATRSGKPSPLNEAAYAINPNLDQKSYKARNEVVTDFAKGKMADAKMFLDRTVNNLAEWDETAKALNNFGPKPGEDAGIMTKASTLLNKPTNAIEGALGSDSPTNYKNAQGALATEMRNVFAKTGQGTLSELKSWESGIGRGFSPKQFEGSKQTFLKLFDGQLSAMAARWNNTMPEKKTKADFLDPESLKKLSEIAPTYYQELTGSAPAAAPAAAGGDISDDDLFKQYLPKR